MEISNVEEYRKVMTELDQLMQRDPPPGSPDGLRFVELATAAEAFEKAHPELTAGVPASQGHRSYRIVRYRSGGGYGLHEVYFDADGQAWGMTEEACGFGCDDDEALREEGKSVDPVSEITRALAMAIRDATTHPIFDEPDVWLGKNPSEPTV